MLPLTYEREKRKKQMSNVFIYDLSLSKNLNTFVKRLDLDFTKCSKKKQKNCSHFYTLVQKISPGIFTGLPFPRLLKKQALCIKKMTSTKMQIEFEPFRLPA